LSNSAQVVESGTDALEQDGLAQLIGLHRRKLDGAQEDPRLSFAEQLDAELPAPPGQVLLGRQRRPCGIDFKAFHRVVSFIRCRSVARTGEFRERCAPVANRHLALQLRGEQADGAFERLHR
jgi:hypothetical protein